MVHLGKSSVLFVVCTTLILSNVLVAISVMASPATPAAGNTSNMTTGSAATLPKASNEGDKQENLLPTSAAKNGSENQEEPTSVPQVVSGNNKKTSEDLPFGLVAIFSDLSLDVLKMLKEHVDKEEMDQFEGVLLSTRLADPKTIADLTDKAKNHIGIVQGLLQAAMKQKEVPTESIATQKPTQPSVNDNSDTIATNAIKDLLKALSGVPIDSLIHLRRAASTDEKELRSVLETLKKEGASGLDDNLMAFASTRKNLVVAVVDMLTNQSTSAVKATMGDAVTTETVVAYEVSTDNEEDEEGQLEGKTQPENTHMGVDVGSDEPGHTEKNPLLKPENILGPANPGDVQQPSGDTDSSQQLPGDTDISQQLPGVPGDTDSSQQLPGDTDSSQQLPGDTDTSQQLPGDTDNDPIPIKTSSGGWFGAWHFLLIFLVIAGFVGGGYICSHNRKKIREGVGSYIADARSRGRRARNYRYQPVNAT